jgi:hypothetical protein
MVWRISQAYRSKACVELSSFLIILSLSPRFLPISRPSPSFPFTYSLPTVNPQTPGGPFRLKFLLSSNPASFPPFPSPSPVSCLRTAPTPHVPTEAIDSVRKESRSACRTASETLFCLHLHAVLMLFCQHRQCTLFCLRLHVTLFCRAGRTTSGTPDGCASRRGWRGRRASG